MQGQGFFAFEVSVMILSASLGSREARVGQWFS
jgi:hypothetical protein